MSRRRLRIRYAIRKGAVPVLVAASCAPIAASCGPDADIATAPLPGADASVSDQGGTGGQLTFGTGNVGNATLFTGGAPNQPSPYPDSNDGGPNSEYGFVPKPPRYDDYCDVFVELPPQGTPALVETICADDLRPVESGWAARVSLRTTDARFAEGDIQIADDLVGRVVGLPEVSVVGLPEVSVVGDDAGAVATFSNVQPRGDGFWFLAELAPFFDGYVDHGEYLSITVRVSFDLRCEGDGGAQTTRRVEALTALYYCQNDWVSSGALCDICAIIAEMAPTPIVPGPTGDDLPLGRAIRLSLKTVAKVGRSLVLLAEHDGGEAEFDYAWRASAGDVQYLSDDVVVWTPPDGDDTHLLQVAVMSRDAAAVASLRWGQAA